MIRKVWLLAVPGLGLLAHFMLASNCAAQDPLDLGARQARLLEDAAHPFVMDIDFTAQFDAPTQGHLRLRWEAKDRWWSKVSVGKFEQARFQKGESTFTSRNVDMTPKQVGELLNLVRVANGYDKLVTRNNKQRVELGVQLDCIDVEMPEFKAQRREICLDATNHDIVKDTRRYQNGDVQREQFSDFVDFEGHRYPRALELTKNGTTIISAHVTDLKEDPLDPQLLVPPKGAIERRECPGIRPPVVISRSEPDYAGSGRENGQTDVELTIMTNGTVGEVHLLGTSSRSQAAAAMDAFKKWKFRPAMCGTEPVVADIQVSTSVQYR